MSLHVLTLVKNDFMMDYWLRHIGDQNLKGLGSDDNMLPYEVTISVSIATKEKKLKIEKRFYHSKKHEKLVQTQHLSEKEYIKKY